MIYSAATTMINLWAEYAQIAACFTGNNNQHQDKPKHQDVAKNSKNHPPTKSSSSHSTATTSTCALSLSSTMVSNSHRRRKTTREASTSRRSTSSRHHRPNQLVEPVSPYEEFPRTWKTSSRRRHHVVVVGAPEDSPYDEAADDTRIQQLDERQPSSYKRTVVDTPRSTVPDEIYLGDDNDIPSHIHVVTELDAVSEYSDVILPDQDNRTLTPHPSFDEGADVRDFHYLYQASLELEQDWPSDEDGPGRGCAFWSHGPAHERHLMNACDLKMVLRDLDDEHESGSKSRLAQAGRICF